MGHGEAMAQPSAVSVFLEVGEGEWGGVARARGGAVIKGGTEFR